MMMYEVAFDLRLVACTTHFSKSRTLETLRNDFRTQTDTDREDCPRFIIKMGLP